MDDPRGDARAAQHDDRPLTFGTTYGVPRSGPVTAPATGSIYVGGDRDHAAALPGDEHRVSVQPAAGAAHELLGVRRPDAVTPRRRGASVTFRFTGRAFALVAPKGPTRGSARCTSMASSRRDRRRCIGRVAAPRIVVAARSWSTAGAHTVKLVVAGTGRPSRGSTSTRSRSCARARAGSAAAVGRHRERRQQQRHVVAPRRCR